MDNGLPALEEQWRLRLKVAESNYNRAKNHTIAVSQDLDGIQNSDNLFAKTEAIRLENIALAEYRRVLIVFSDLVLRRRMPPREKTGS